MTVEMAADLADTASDSIVILLHGTWARDWLERMRGRSASWCREGSDLRHRICAALGENTRFEELNWSGSNSTRARLSAARRLRERILQLRAENPHAQLFAICHSHGGNVACYALCDPAAASEIAGVVYLSTPFVSVTRRRIPQRIGERLEMTGSFAVLISAVWLGIHYAPEAASALFHFFRTAPTWLFLLTLLPPAVALGLLVKYALVPAWRKIHRWSQEFDKTLRLPKALPCPSLVLTRKGDEAYVVLGLAQLLSRVLSRMIGTLAEYTPLLGEHSKAPASMQQANRAERWLRITGQIEWVAGAMLLLAFSLLLLLLLARHTGVLPTSRDLVLGIVTITAAGLLISSVAFGVRTWLFLTVLPITLALALLLAFTTASYGLRFALAASGLEIWMQAQPPWSSARCAFVKLPTPPFRVGRWTLRHATHSDPEALKILEQWLHTFRG